jgi:hypothetical protein
MKNFNKKKNSVKKAFLAAAAFIVVVLPQTPIFSACYILVHGHRDSNQTWSQASAYWAKDDSWPFDDTDFRAQLVGRSALDTSQGTNDNWTVVNWNPLVAHWTAAVEVAGKLNTILNGGNDGGGRNCGSQTSKVIVAHSMGGVVLDFIMGNAKSGDPNYNYQGANFANVYAKASRVITVQSPHNGTDSANAVCGGSSWGCNTLAYFVASCDTGTASLQTIASWQVATYANYPAVGTYMIGGYQAMLSSSCLNGEDDGVVAHSNAYACPLANALTSYSTSNAGCAAKMESANFWNGDQTHEDHDYARNDEDRDDRLAISDANGGDWWSGNSSTGTEVRGTVSSAEIIRCIWSNNKGSSCDGAPD